jgi:hypothetical protein
MINVLCRSTVNIILVSALLGFSAACSSVHDLHASSGQSSRSAMAQAFGITKPECATLPVGSRMLRVTTRPFVGGESCLLVQWKPGGEVLLTTQTSDACIHCVVSNLEPGQTNVKVATVKLRRYSTQDARVIELLEVMREQLNQLTFYERVEYIDPTDYDFELYEHAGVKRRMTIQGVMNKPYQGSLLLDAAYKLEQFPLARNKEKWDRETMNDYQEYMRKNPTKILVPPIQEVLASHPTEQELLAQCIELARELKASEQSIVAFRYDPSDDLIIDPKSGEKVDMHLTTIHPQRRPQITSSLKTMKSQQRSDAQQAVPPDRTTGLLHHCPLQEFLCCICLT